RSTLIGRYFRPMRYPAHLFAIACIVIMSGCSGSAIVPDSAQNRTATYEPGSPNFDLDAIASVSEGRPGLDIYLSIPHTSLVYIQQGEGYRATYDAHVRISATGASTPIYQETWSDTLLSQSYESTQSFGRAIRIERVDLSAGAYEVEVSLEDAESGATTVRRQVVTVPEPEVGQVALSQILLRVSRNDEPTDPAVFIHIPKGYDSLQAVTELYNAPDELSVRFALIRFASDTLVATPPHWFTPAHFTLEYMGVDYQDHDTVQVSRRTIRDAADGFEMEFDRPVLANAVYMAVVSPRGSEDLIESRRYFTIQGESFPRVGTLRDMVAALAYIARDREMDYITAAESEEELKRRFDAFWAERVPNRQAAANLLARYYERVEEANVLFTSHKEGWKTDRGMIYIVFGPPAYVENRFNRRDWYYYERGGIVSRALPPF